MSVPMDEAETRLDTVESTLGRHETRLQYVEAPLRVVLRGFDAVQEFLRVLRANDMKSAKIAFIPSLCDELREKCGPEVHHLIEEAEKLLVDRQGWVVIGVYPTGGDVGHKGGRIDAVATRLCWATAQPCPHLSE